MTGISLFQHPDLANRGTEQTRTTVTKSGKKIKQLLKNYPFSYTTVPAIAKSKKDPPVPKVCSLSASDCSLAAKEGEKEKNW